MYEQEENVTMNFSFKFEKKKYYKRNTNEKGKFSKVNDSDLGDCLFSSR